MKYVLVELLARDVTFIDNAEYFYNSIINHPNIKDNVKKYFNTTFKNFLIENYSNVERKLKYKKDDLEWMKRKIDKGEKVFTLKEFSEDDKKYFALVFKYLSSLPDKPIKINPNDLPNLIQKWRSIRKKQISQSGIVTEIKCPNGFTWNKLVSKESVLQEGEIMQNCLRQENMGYLEMMKNKECQIYSLRDQNGKSHVNIDIIKGKINQILGKNNKVPKTKFLPYVDIFLKTKNIKISNDDLLGKKLFYYNDKLYSLYEIPENCIIYGNIRQLQSTTVRLNQSGIKFIIPKNCTIRGNLELPKHHINMNDVSCIIIEEGLTVTGNLDLSESDGVLPKGLKVDGNLYLTSSKIKEIPEDTIIGGNLNIEDTDIEVPLKLKVGGRVEKD